MDLTIPEVAVVLGRSPRTVRRQLKSGELRGRKQGGHWIVARRDLPLTPAQRRDLQAKADAIRGTVESALPPAVRHGTARALRELDVFEHAARALATLDGAPAALLRDAMMCLAEAHFEFDAPRKVTRLRDTRALVARAIATLEIDAATDAADALVDGVLPRLAGLTRWAEGLERTAA